MKVNLRMNNGQSGPLYAGFTRLQNFPLDSDSVKDSLAELKEYIKTGGNIYNGQIITVLGASSSERRTYVVRDLTAETFEDSVVEIADGGDIIRINQTINDRIQEVNSAIDNINSDLDDYKDKNEEIIKNINLKIETNKKSCDDGLTAVRALVGENKKLIEANEEAIKSAKKELQANIDQTTKNLNAHIENYNQTKSKLDETISNLAETRGDVSNLKTNQDALAGKIAAIETWKGETTGFLENVCTKDYFIEQIQKVDLNNYYKKSEIDEMFKNKLEALQETISKEITDKINKALESFTGIMRYKGTKNTYDDLPKEGNEVGDIWNVKADDMNYAWSGTNWDQMGSSVKLDGYATEEWVQAQGYSKLTEADIRERANEIITLKLAAYKTSEDLAKEYYSKEEVDTKIAEIATGGTIDLTNYYTKEAADKKFVGFDITSIKGGTAASTK